MFIKSPEVEVADVEAATVERPTIEPLRLLVLVGLLASAWVFGGWSLFVVIMSVLTIVFLHELAHFVTARRAGMKVTEFFFGFGPRIFSFKRGEVEYGVKAIPAGAYVRIIGMSSLDEIDPVDEPKTYRQQPWRWRVLVASAGVIMHVVLAFILIWAVLVFNGREQETGWTIREVSPGSAAAAAGAQPGDRLVSIAGEQVSTFTDMTDIAEAHAGQSVAVLLERGDRQLASTVTLLSKASVWGTVGEDLPLASDGTDVRLTGVQPRSRADEAGLASGDIVTRINGVAITDLASVQATLAAAATGTLELTVDQGGRSTDTTLDLGKKVKLSDPKGFFGVGQQLGVQRLGVLEAVPAAGASLADVTGQMVKGLGGVFSVSGISHMFERVSTAPSNAGPSEPESASQTMDGQKDRMSSIIGAVDVGSGLFQDGWVSAFRFMALLNLTLALINFLPLLPFDGGHVVVASYEKVREMMRRTNERYFVDGTKLVPLAVAVIAVFLLLGLMSAYLDITQRIRV